MRLKKHMIALACAALLLPLGMGVAQAQAQASEQADWMAQAQEPCEAAEATENAGAGGISESELCQLHAQVQQALLQERWLEVELLLERVLMFRPNDAQAMFQLALVLALRDRPEGAKALIATLRDDDRTSQAHRKRLQLLLDNEDLRASSQAVNAAARVHEEGSSTQLVWSLGRSSNPMALTGARSVQLTLPDGQYELALEARRRSATTLNGLLYQRWASGLQLLVSTQNATAEGAKMGARVSLAGPLGLSTAWLWNISSQQSLDGLRRHTANLLWPSQSQGDGLGANALYSLGYFSEDRGARDGFLLRAQSSLGRWQGRHGSLQLNGWLEYEHSLTAMPSALRAGMQGQWSLSPGWQMHGNLHAQQDLSGYNPLLRNGRARNTMTGYIALERQWLQPWWGGYWSSSLYLSKRWSNIVLFTWADRGVSLSWRRSW